MYIQQEYVLGFIIDHFGDHAAIAGHSLVHFTGLFI